MSNVMSNRTGRSSGAGIGLRLGALLLLLAGLAGTVQAATTYTWTGTTDTAWSSPGNWNPAGPPTTGDNVILISPANKPSNQDIVGLSLNSLTYDATATTTFTLGGSAITLGAGGLTVITGATAQTISANIVLGTSQIWNNLSASILTISGTLTGAAGTEDLEKIGTGSVYFTNNSSPTHRNTTVSRGTLAFRPTVTGAYAFGSGTLRLNGGTFAYNGATTANYPLSNSIEVTSAGGTIDFGRAGNNPNDIFTGPVTLGGNLTLYSGGGGGGTWQADFQGAWTITGGNRTIIVNNGSNSPARISGNIGEDGTSRVLTLNHVADNVDFVISGATNSWSGGTVVTGSGVHLTIVTATSSLGTGAVTIQNGGKLQINDPANVAGTGNITVNAGGMVEIATMTYVTGLGEVNTASTGMIRTLGTSVFDLNASGHAGLFVGTTGSNNAVNITNAWTPNGTTFRVGGGFTGAMTFNTLNMLSGANDVLFGTPWNNGPTTLTTDQSYTGATTVNGGTVIVGGTVGKVSGTTGVTVAGAILQDGGTGGTDNDDTVTTNRIPTADALTLGSSTLGGGTFTLALPIAAAKTHSQTFTSLSVAPGANTIKSINTAGAGSTGTFTLSANPALSRSAGGTWYVDQATGFGTVSRTRAVSSSPLRRWPPMRSSAVGRLRTVLSPRRRMRAGSPRWMPTVMWSPFQPARKRPAWEPTLTVGAHSRKRISSSLPTRPQPQP